MRNMSGRNRGLEPCGFPPNITWSEQRKTDDAIGLPTCQTAG